MNSRASLGLPSQHVRQVIPIRTITRGNSGPGRYRISPDGRSVVSGAYDQQNVIAVWSLR